MLLSREAPELPPRGTRAACPPVCLRLAAADTACPQPCRARCAAGRYGLLGLLRCWLVSYFCNLLGSLVMVRCAALRCAGRPHLAARVLPMHQACPAP